MKLISKKSEFPLIKVLVIMLVTVIILISYIFILIGYRISINDNKLQTQIIIDKLINNNCFSDQFLQINEKEFNQNNLDNCLSNINKDKSLIRIKLEDKEPLFLSNRKQEFLDKANLCNLVSNILCTEMYYPVIFQDNNNKFSSSNLIIQVIQSN